jgi:hypothetical protein
MVLVNRVELDERLSKTCPLAENIARVMHELRPRRYPATILDEDTNHLRNATLFLPRANDGPAVK